MKILVYADSRGLSFFDKFKSVAHKTYCERLKEEYVVVDFVGKWSPLVKFFEVYEEKYEIVVLNAGLVDHLPREKNKCLSIYGKHKLVYDSIFGEENMKKHLKTDFGIECKYMDSLTTNMYSYEMAQEYMVPKLKKIKNLIWIGSNAVFDGFPTPKYVWPKNAGLLFRYDKLFMENSLPINLSLLTKEDVKRYTYDCIHFNAAGHSYIYDRLSRCIKDAMVQI